MYIATVFKFLDIKCYGSVISDTPVGKMCKTQGLLYGFNILLMAFCCYTKGLKKQQKIKIT